MGKFNPSINQIITHFVSAGVQRFSLASNALSPDLKVHMKGTDFNATVINTSGDPTYKRAVT